MKYRYGDVEFSGYDPDDDEPFLALYWRYHVPCADPHESAASAIAQLCIGEDYGELSSTAVVRHATGEVIFPTAECDDIWDAYEVRDRFDAIDVTPHPPLLEIEA